MRRLRKRSAVVAASFSCSGRHPSEPPRAPATTSTDSTPTRTPRAHVGGGRRANSASTNGVRSQRCSSHTRPVTSTAILMTPHTTG